MGERFYSERYLYDAYRQLESARTGRRAWLVFFVPALSTTQLYSRRRTSGRSYKSLGPSQSSVNVAISKSETMHH